MGRYILHVKEAPVGGSWIVEDLRTPGPKRPDLVNQVVVEAENGSDAMRLYVEECEAAGKVPGRGPDTPNGEPVDMDKHQYQVLKVEPIDG